LKRAINIPEYITMQLDQISTLSLNAKGSNNNAIYYTASSGDKLQPAVLCILRKTRVEFFTIYDRSINQILNTTMLLPFYLIYIKMKYNI